MQADHFEAFYRRSYRRTVAIALATTGHAPSAEEAAQDAYTEAWKRFASLDERTATAWVGVVARNKAMRSWRRARHRESLEALFHRRSRLREDSEDRVLMDLLIASLPRRYREVLVLSLVIELPHEEIAQILQIPQGTVKSRLSRARAALTREWSGLVTIPEEKS